MGRVVLIRLLALYLPLLGCIAIIFWRRPNTRLLTGAFLAFVWNLVWLLPLGRVAAHFDWWSFAGDVPSLLGTPIDLWIGWALLWGALPVLVAPHRMWVPALVVIWLDFALMPLMKPLVHLDDAWILGELAGVVLCLGPGLALASWTVAGRKLAARASLQVIAFTTLVLVVVPWAVTEARGRDVSDLVGSSLALKSLVLLLLAAPLTLGASAVQEFWQRGLGTPLPLDPPKRLVKSGPYAYVANPMQFSIVIVLATLSIGLRDVWFAIGSGISVAFSAGIARWNEISQLQQRFGEEWLIYRSRVRNWFPRWRPIYSDTPANGRSSKLYYATSCEQCRSVGEWIRARRPVGLEMVPAETSPVPLRRMTYAASDGTTESGVAAFGRALEHMNLAWALFGWLIRLPILNQVIQLIVDASGGGPRNIPYGACPVKSDVNAA